MIRCKLHLYSISWKLEGAEHDARVVSEKYVIHLLGWYN